MYPGEKPFIVTLMIASDLLLRPLPFDIKGYILYSKKKIKINSYYILKYPDVAHPGSFSKPTFS